jgi:hypothetical protein
MFDYNKLRAPILTVLVIVLTVFMDFPLSYAIVLILFFWIRTFGITEKIEKKIHDVYPGFIDHHELVRRAIPYAVYLLLLISLKFLVIDIVMERILHIPARQELMDFITKLAE